MTPNLQEFTQQLKMVPDPLLQQMAMAHRDDPMVLPLILNESQQRQQARAGQMQPVQPQPSIVDQQIAQMASLPRMDAQPPQMNPQLGQALQAQQLVAQATGKKMARGGIVSLAGAGSTGKLSPIEQALNAEGITDPQERAFVKAIYQQESSSGADTRTSNRGAVGGMQVTPGAFKDVADDGWSIKNPDQNMRAGVRYAVKSLRAANGDLTLGAVHYYGGPGGLAAARKGQARTDPQNPDNPDTLEYGKQVAERAADILTDEPTPAKVASAAQPEEAGVSPLAALPGAAVAGAVAANRALPLVNKAMGNAADVTWREIGGAVGSKARAAVPTGPGNIVTKMLTPLWLGASAANTGATDTEDYRKRFGLELKPGEDPSLAGDLLARGLGAASDIGDTMTGGWLGQQKLPDWLGGNYVFRDRAPDPKTGQPAPSIPEKIVNKFAPMVESVVAPAKAAPPKAGIASLPVQTADAQNQFDNGSMQALMNAAPSQQTPQVTVTPDAAPPAAAGLPPAPDRGINKDDWLQFGLGLMAGRSPNFMSNVGTAGLEALKAKQEQQKLDSDEVYKRAAAQHYLTAGIPGELQLIRAAMADPRIYDAVSQFANLKREPMTMAHVMDAWNKVPVMEKMGYMQRAGGDEAKALQLYVQTLQRSGIMGGGLTPSPGFGRISAGLPGS